MSFWNFVNAGNQAVGGLLRGKNVGDQENYRRSQEAAQLAIDQQRQADDHRQRMLEMYMMQNPPQAEDPIATEQRLKELGLGRYYQPPQEPAKPTPPRTQVADGVLYVEQPDGSWKPATPKPSQAAGGGKPASPAQVKGQIGAEGGMYAIDQIQKLLAEDPGANITPETSAAMEGLGHAPVIGGMLRGVVESQRQHRMTPNQQKFQAYMDAVLHNAVGLLPGSRQSQALFENLRQTYVPGPGQSEQARAAKMDLLKELQRRLAVIRSGQFTADQVEYYLTHPEAEIPGDTYHTESGGNTPLPAAVQAPASPVLSSPPKRANPAQFYRP